MQDERQLGVGALNLLAQRWMICIVDVLAQGPARPAQLERLIPTAGHGALIRRLQQLRERELVQCDHRPGVPPHPNSVGIAPEASYRLTIAGIALLAVIHEAMAWESHWTPQPQRRTPAGAGAIRLLADRHTRAIMLSLADEPQSTGELERRSPLSRSALRNRLRRLVLDGLLRARKDGCERRFELSEGSRRLASVALLAGRWEWQWERPAHNRPGSDLHSLLHILAPAVRVPEPIAGVFHLRLAVKGADDGNIYLAAQDGNIRTLTGAPSSRPQASAHGTPEAWCDLLLEDDGPITMTGDREQLCQIVRAMRVALTQELPEAGRVGPRLRKHLE